MKNKTMLSRRAVLKTLLAFGGGTALSTLPRQWETPVVEVGLLPVHAQLSGPLTVVSTTYAPTGGVNNCGSGSIQGTDYNLALGFSDPSAGITSAATVRIVSTFLPSGGSLTLYDGQISGSSLISISGSASSGTVNVSQICTRFNADTSNRLDITLTNTAGQSVSASVTVSKPAGAFDAPGVGTNTLTESR